MPNYSFNTLIVSGDRKTIKKMFKAIKSENQLIDFNKIIPEPSKYKTSEEIDINKYISDPKYREDSKVKKIEKKNKKLIDWRGEHWFTNHNAFDCKKIDFNIIKFTTTYSFPYPIYEKLASDYKSLNFIIVHADECYDSDYTDSFMFENGKIMKHKK